MQKITIPLFSLALSLLATPALAFPSSNCAEVTRNPGAPEGPLPETLDLLVPPDADWDGYRCIVRAGTGEMEVVVLQRFRFNAYPDVPYVYLHGPNDLQLGVYDQFGRISNLFGCYTAQAEEAAAPDTTCYGSLTGNARLTFNQDFDEKGDPIRAFLEVNATEFANFNEDQGGGLITNHGGAADVAVRFEEGNQVFDLEPTDTPGLFEQTTSGVAVAVFNAGYHGAGEMRVLYSWETEDGEERATYTRREAEHVSFYTDLYLRVRREFMEAFVPPAE